MSYATMPSPAAAECETETIEARSAEKFHDDLLNGLHAVAQPLTVLRAAVEMLTRAERTGIDRKRYLEITAEQMARTCDLFASVRDLVTSNVMEAQMASFDLWELLAPAIEDQAGRLQRAGVGLAVASPEPWQPAVGDAERTEQAFRAMLNAAISLASHGDVIEVQTARTQGFAEITVKNARCHGKRPSSSDRLGLSLAEVNILSQQGRYRCACDPFCCSFALPLQKPGHPAHSAQNKKIH
jgi:hypothetical protein